MELFRLQQIELPEGGGGGVSILCDTRVPATLNNIGQSTCRCDVNDFLQFCEVFTLY